MPTQFTSLMWVNYIYIYIKLYIYIFVYIYVYLWLYYSLMILYYLEGLLLMKYSSLWQHRVQEAASRLMYQEVPQGQNVVNPGNVTMYHVPMYKL